MLKENGNEQESLCLSNISDDYQSIDYLTIDTIPWES